MSVWMLDAPQREYYLTVQAVSLCSQEERPGMPVSNFQTISLRIFSYNPARFVVRLNTKRT